MTTASNDNKSHNNQKTVLLKIDPKLHGQLKKLAKFQGMTIQSAGTQAIEDWVEYVIENEVKPTIKNLRTQARLGSEIIKG